jgi:hypothetical protein
MEQELDDFIEWLRVLRLPEKDFRRHVRPYFDDTSQMEVYIESRMPQTDMRSVDPEPTKRTIPTMPAPVIQELPPRSGHYKGKRRRR